MSFRDPFVWEMQARRDVLDDEWARLRELPYSVWRDIVLRGPITKSVTGRDQKSYHVEVSAQWDDGSDVRVTLSLMRSRGLRRRLLTQTFVVTPRNEVRA